MYGSRRGLVCAAVVVLSLAYPAAAEELARLFFSPHERQALNQKRNARAKAVAPQVSKVVEANADGGEEVSESVPLPPPKITGRVVRSSGNNTVWVNHYPHYKRGRQ